MQHRKKTGGTLSQAEMARRLGLSRATLSRLVRAGMPLTSVEDALEWRKANPPRRAATRGKGVEAGSSEAGKYAILSAPKTGDQLLDAVRAAIVVSDVAYAEFMAAVASNSPARSARLSEHNKALEARLKAEKLYREEMERRGVLVEKAKVMELARQAIEAVLKRLKRLPAEAGPQCNPSDAVRAVKVLEREVEKVMSAGAREINGLISAKLC